MTTWFTADLHLGHGNIIDYSGRPHDDVEAMNHALIDGWNQTVADDDVVWILGDFALGKLADTLPLVGELRGRKILLAGNHDRCWDGHGRRSEGWTQKYRDAGKTSELLMRLALEAGVLVRTDRFVDEVWGEALNTRRNTLQSKIAKLRRAFGDPPLVVSGDGGYKLAVDPSEVDALVVLDHVAEVSRLLDGGDDREAADLCASTLKMYRGDILPAAGDGEWVNPHRARLEEARMKLVETQFSARLRLGDTGDVIGELEAAVAAYPYQEGLW